MSLGLEDSQSLTDIIKRVERSTDNPRLIRNTHTAVTALLNHTSSEVYEAFERDEVTARAWLEILKDIEDHCKKTIASFHRRIIESKEDLSDD